MGLSARMMTTRLTTTKTIKKIHYDGYKSSFYLLCDGFTLPRTSLVSPFYPIFVGIISNKKVAGVSIKKEKGLSNSSHSQTKNI